MKTRFRKIIDVLTGWIRPAAVFEADGLRFRILSVKEQTCEVAAGGERRPREIVIPAKVERNGLSYSVVAIGRGAFKHRTGLDSVVIPESVTKVGREAFSCCFELISVQMLGSVESIGREAFWCCTGLRRFVSMNPIPPSVSMGTFENASLADCRLMVPKEAVVKYKMASWWKRFRSIEGIDAESV